MAAWWALLRAVNVSGHNVVTMAALRTSLEAAGFRDVVTLLQSGNVRLAADLDEDAIVAAVEAALSRMGVMTTAIVRSAGELEAVVAQRPFPADDGRLYVGFLTAAPTVGGEALASLAQGREEVAVVGRHVYLRCPDGYGQSRLNNQAVERRLGVGATTRSWATVLKLAASSL